MLDIEKDPTTQGFDAGAYDVIIADNVLHATEDISVTLCNVRTLLKANGKLILREQTAPDQFLTGFEFGLLPGWWPAVEDNRQSSPCLDREQWHNAMRTAGFSGTDICIPDFHNTSYSRCTFMIGTALDPVSEVPPHMMPSTTCSPIFILESTSNVQVELATLVSEFVSCGEPRSTDLMRAASLAASEPHQHNFVFLYEIHRPVLLDIQESTFIALKAVLASAKSILWVRRGGGGNSCQEPEFALSDGFCRVSRYENNKVINVTLAFQTLDNQIRARLIAKVYRKMLGNEAYGSSAYEQEFSEWDSRLHVNRVRQAKHLDEHIHRRTKDVIIPQNVAGRRLQLGIRVPGLLDTLEWSEDNRARHVLAPYESK